jgi:hypothetical protein
MHAFPSPARPCRRASHRSRGQDGRRQHHPGYGTLVELSVKAGDRVLFGKWSGSEVKIDGEELLIMKESDILGIVETEASSK